MYAHTHTHHTHTHTHTHTTCDQLYSICRHPDPEKRPTFGMVYGAIEVKGLALLAVDSAAIRSSTVHTNAHIIGAPLVAGEGLYRDLQVAYR